MPIELSLHEAIRLSLEVGEAYIDGVAASPTLRALVKDIQIELDAIDKGCRSELKRLKKSWVLVYRRLEDVAEATPAPAAILGIKGISAMRRILDLHVPRRNLRSARESIEVELGERL